MSFRVHRETVKFSGGEFAVRGLSLNDVSALMREHREALGRLFVEFQSQNIDKAGEYLFASAPEVVASIIALAADDPGGEYDKLPAGVSVLAVEKIGKMTFDGDASLGKVLEVLTGAVEGISRVSTSGSAAFDATLPS